MSNPPYHTRNTSSFGFVADQFVRRLLMRDDVALNRIKQVWNQIVDRALSGSTQPSALRVYRHSRYERVLFVDCSSGAAQYLSMEKNNILSRIEETLSYTHIRDIKHEFKKSKRKAV